MRSPIPQKHSISAPPPITCSEARNAVDGFLNTSPEEQPRPIARKILLPSESILLPEYSALPYCHHEGVSLFLMQEGNATALVNNERIPLSAGDILAVNPFEAHGIFVKDLNAPFAMLRLVWHPHRIFPLESEGERFFAALRTLHFPHHIAVGTPPSSTLRRGMEHILQALKTRKESGYVRAYAELISLYATLTEIGIMQENTAETSHVYAFMSLVSAYLEENLDEDISTADIAAYCQYTTEHFCRLFKKCFGRTFKDYLNIYRIRRAKDYIDAGNYGTLAEISSKCGFNNQNHFSHMFKKYIGSLPSEYSKKDHNIAARQFITLPHGNS